jgi:hypothetical protein
MNEKRQTITADRTQKPQTLTFDVTACAWAVSDVEWRDVKYRVHVGRTRGFCELVVEGIDVEQWISCRK